MYSILVAIEIKSDDEAYGAMYSILVAIEIKSDDEACIFDRKAWPPGLNIA